VRRPTTPRRNAAAVTALTLVTFALGATLAVFVAGSASAASSKTTTTRTTSKTTTSKTAASNPTLTSTTATTESPGDSFFVINGTVNAASDHEIVGSSAFPNFTTGAVDNYYSMARSHVDNSPFAEGTASPADTGPIGQTAAAGNFQQTQYADARWPGDPSNATYGRQGGPYATAAAGEYRATAEASEATNGLSGPGPSGPMTLAVPKGFDGQLRQALAAWKAKWQSLAPNKPTPTVTTPIGTVTVPKPGVSTPTATVTTPIATVTTPTPPTPTPTVPTLPSATAKSAPRSLASLSKSQSPAAASTPGDGELLLTSSTSATLVPGTQKAKTDTTQTATTKTTTTKTSTTKTGTAKTYASKTAAPTTDTAKTYTLVTSGESSLGRVTLGGGQIVIEGIHVTASIANDGTPAYKAAVSIASASIGGIPVTIDQDGVHVAGQVQGLPYKQASDGLNGALKQAGIQLFLVGPEVTTNSCGQSGAGTGTSSNQPGTTSNQPGTTSNQPGTTSNQPGTTSNQPGATSSCDQSGAMCDQSGAGPVGGIGTNPTTTTTSRNTTTTSSDQSGTTTTPSSCGQSGTTATCDQTGTATGGSTNTGGGTGIGKTTTTTTTTTSKDQSGTTTTPSSCDQSGMTAGTSPCSKTSTATGTATTSSNQFGTSTTPSSSDALSPYSGMSNSGEETVTATGLHVVFTQPVNQPGVPAQYVEHILGEVFVDSLAVPAPPLSSLDLSSSFSSSSSSSSCLGRGRSTSGGGLTAGGSSTAGGLTSSGSTFGSTSQPTSSSTGNSLPAAFALALRKPLWLLLAYVLWQSLVIGTGWSLWNWRRGGTS